MASLVIEALTIVVASRNASTVSSCWVTVQVARAVVRMTGGRVYKTEHL